ncbi:discoidin domain-containing protein [bacterium]|nr:discoidin domain-containing protein [bacterium]
MSGVVSAAPRLALIGAPPGHAFASAAGELGLSLQAADAPAPADYGALLVCAAAYPQVQPLPPATQQTLEAFLAAGRAVYVEYTPLPGLVGDKPQTAIFERLVAPGDALRGVPELAVLEEHASRFLPLVGEAPQARVLLTYAKVAGMDRAVFGLPDETAAALVELPRGPGRLLLSATALSHWQTGRYRPTRLWAALTREVLLALLPADQAAAARRRFVDLGVWTEPRDWAAVGEPVRLCVRAPAGHAVTASGPGGALTLHDEAGLLVSAPLKLSPGRHDFRVSAGPAERTVRVTLSPRPDRYRETLQRNLRWFRQAPMLVAPDGSQGVREGLTSTLGPGGKPTVGSGLRVDCVSECGLLFFLYGQVAQDADWRECGRRMLEYTARAFSVTSKDCWYFGHWQSRGEFRDDGSTVYVFNDDSGAGTLFSLLGYVATGDRRQLQAGLRGVEFFCHVASDKSGLPGYMSHRDYEGSGHTGTPWPKLRAQEIKHAAPHVMNLPLASLLVAYRLTGEARYLQIAERGCRTLMTDYPDWHIVTSRTCEHGRMLLPLALLYGTTRSPEHRAWLDTVVDYLVGRQAPCGAMQEWDGYNPSTNAAFGTAENSVFQQNGDPISDQLYGTGFALLHLGLAAQITGDPRIRQTYRRLGDYLARIQLADTDPLYDGTWLRAFDYGRWEYFGSSADIGWGPYCAETGWSCGPLGLGLLMELQPKLLSLPAQPDPTLKPLAEAARAEADAVEAALSAPPSAVAGLRAEPSRAPYALLRWDVPEAGVLIHRVHRATEPGFTPGPGNLIGTTHTGQWLDLQLPMDNDLYYRVVAANGLGQTGPASDPVQVRTGGASKARGCKYTKSPQPHPSFTDPGDSVSTDGVYAGPYRDRKSYGYRLAQVDAEIAVVVTVDLGRPQEIAWALHHNCGAPGYRPDVMAVSVSTDGETWREVGRTADAVNDSMIVAFAGTTARWVRFGFTKRRTAATDDWLFLDELEVY